jgi:hypothetical protein
VDLERFKMWQVSNLFHNDRPDEGEFHTRVVLGVWVSSGEHELDQSFWQVETFKGLEGLEREAELEESKKRRFGREWSWSEEN